MPTSSFLPSIFFELRKVFFHIRVLRSNRGSFVSKGKKKHSFMWARILLLPALTGMTSESTWAAGKRPSLLDHLSTIPEEPATQTMAKKPVEEVKSVPKLEPPPKKPKPAKRIPPKTKARPKQKKSLLAQLPLSFGDWQLHLNAKQNMCVLEHAPLEFNDGIGISHLTVLVKKNMLTISTPTPIAPLGTDAYIKIDMEKPVYLESMTRNKASIRLNHNILISQMQSGLQAFINIAFWPNLQVAHAPKITLNLKDFDKANTLLSRCQSQLKRNT